jgi:hypothetical protein
MNDPSDSDLPEIDPVLEAAGARLRAGASPLSSAVVEAAVLRRRTRRLGLLTVAAVAVSGLLAGALVVEARSGDDPGPVRSRGSGGGSLVDGLLASLDPEPVDPTTVQLVSTVSTFPDCESLIDDLRQVGAEHVGSRGFGAFGAFGGVFSATGDAYGRDAYGGTARDLLGAAPTAAAAPDGTGGAGGAQQPVTLGTNVQVAGVDELDHVKAVGNLIYDLDGRGNLRITDADQLQVLAILDVTPGPAHDSANQVEVSELLVDGDHVVVFGADLDVSEPVAGDPSATQATTSYLTVTFVDAGDPAAPAVTDRVRVEGRLVSARLVDGEVRLVASSDMADLGFVMPTTPASVAKALEQNRRSVATSSVADWIPDWQHGGESPEPLVPCDRVHVPDTFSGVAVTSMVTFPAAAERFEPAATSILAPAATLYAGLDRVAISSEVWVDPADRGRLEFDDWQTAVHELRFTKGAPPSYEGSGIVDGSTVGQFAYGEIGKSLAVVTTEGTPWEQQPDLAVDLTVLSSDGDGHLATTAQVGDIAGGEGAVTAVRFLDGRVLVSTGDSGRTVHVIDVTDPSQPRQAGSTTVPGSVGYFHPLPEGQALVVASRSDEVGTGDRRMSRPWVQVHLLDVSDPDAPQVLATWERSWSYDAVAQDHHAFTFWPERHLAMWGVIDARSATVGQQPGPHHAVVLSADAGLAEVAAPEATQPPETPAPCPVVEVTDPDARQMIGPAGVVLRCEDAHPTSLDWPRFQCSPVDDATIQRFTREDLGDSVYFLCSPAPAPSVSRVLVVAGVPILLTDQTLETLDPTTFESVRVVPHPTSPIFSAFGF